MSEKVDNRELIANFIHNAAEMEKRIYILNATKNNCIQKSNKILATAKQNIKKAESEKCKAEENVSRGTATTKILKRRKKFSITSLIQKIEESFKDVFRFIRFLYEVIILFFDFLPEKLFNTQTFLVGCLCCPIFMCLCAVKYLILFFLSCAIGFIVLLAPFLLINDSSEIIMYLLFPWIVATLIAFVRRTILEKKERKRLIALSMALNISSDNNLKSVNNALNLAKQEYRWAEQKSNFLLKQARICENSSREINSLLQKCYMETDIVKEDFRHIDCLIILDFAFRNDLVDTVREGIQYYETKVFHRGVIKGINNICSRLDELTVAVEKLRIEFGCINESIDALNANSEEIISSFSRSVGLQKEILATQKRTLESSKATQYATESLRDSFVWYNNNRKWYQ